MNAPQKPPLKALRFTLFRDIEPAPRKIYLVTKLLGAGEMSCIFGQPGSAKSLLATDMGCHIAAGLPWFGRAALQGGVLYVAAERAKLVERRLAAFRRHHGLHDLPLAVVAGSVDLRSSGEHAALIAGYARDLADMTESPTRLIIIDTVSRVLNGGDENSPKDMGALVATLTDLQEATAAHVCLLHHVPQDGNNRLRGHGALLGALDTTLAVEKVGAIRTATVIKDNDGAEGERLAFDIKGVFLSEDSETGEETFAPVLLPIESEMPKPNPARKLNDRYKSALDVLTGLCIAGKPAPAAFGLPNGIRIVTVDQWRDELFRAGIIEAEAGNPREDFRRIKTALLARKFIGERDKLVWRAAL